MRAYGKSDFTDMITSPPWTDKAGQPYGCCTGHRGICPQHAEQRKQDLRELGFWLTARRVTAGMFRDFAIE